MHWSFAAATLGISEWPYTQNEVLIRDHARYSTSKARLVFVLQADVQMSIKDLVAPRGPFMCQPCKGCSTATQSRANVATSGTVAVMFILFFFILH